MPMTDASVDHILSIGRARPTQIRPNPSASAANTLISTVTATTTPGGATVGGHTNIERGVIEMNQDPLTVHNSTGVQPMAIPATSAVPHKSNVEGMLLKFQGQKWTNLFDFDRMLKQIRNCERSQLRGGSGGHNSNEGGALQTNNCNSNSANSLSVPSSVSLPSSPSALGEQLGSSPAHTSDASSASSNGSKGTTGRIHAARPKQVQRLCGSDMHYYGIVPRQTTPNVMICNHCRGFYTKIGFNNHMMIQHPALWHEIPGKVPSISGGQMSPSTANATGTIAGAHTEHSQEALPAVESLGSPSDILSAVMSTCSNGSSSTSSSLSAPPPASAPTTIRISGLARGKGTTSHSGSGVAVVAPSGKPRAKTKHRHQAAVPSVASGVTPTIVGNGSTAKTTLKNGGTSKSSSLTNKKTTAKDVQLVTVPHTTGSGKPFSEAMKSLAAYASSVSTSSSSSSSSSSTSSSNSSCSMPPTGRLLDRAAAAAQTNATDGKLVGHDRIEPIPSVTVRTKSGNKKKAAKSPVVVGGYHGGHESRDSLSSSSEASYKMGTATGNSRDSAATSTPAGETHLNELDRAVSSITDIDEMTIRSTNVMTAGDRNPVKFLSATVVDDVGPPQSATSGSGVDDPDSMFTFDDKFINEILNTADGDIQFDESALETGNNNGNGNQLAIAYSAQQQQQQHQHQPLQVGASRKRIHYDADDNVAVPQNTSSAELASILQQQHDQQKQQQQQQRPQYSTYDTGSGDVKLFGVDQIQQVAPLPYHQPQQTLTTIDAMQLQQLLYQQQQQQQQHGAVSGSIIEVQQQQQQEPGQEANHQEQFLEVKQFIDLCTVAGNGTDGGNKLAVEYARIASLGTAEAVAYETALSQEQHHHIISGAATLFDVSDVPSLTDDMVTEDETMNVAGGAGAGGDGGGGGEVDTVVDAASGLMLPPGLLIANATESEVVDHQQQQQTQQYYEVGGQPATQQQQHLLAEFLTQTTYETTSGQTITTSVTQPESAGTATAGRGIWQVTTAATTAVPNPTVEDDEDGLCDFDFSRIDTVQSTATDNSGMIASNNIINNNNNNNKYNDDFYLNVFIYAGMPRPLAMNSFGMVKLPQSAAVTFRKAVLTMRKANNSPITLGGGGGGVGLSNLNGVLVGGSPSNSGGTRLSKIPGGAGDVQQLQQQQQQHYTKGGNLVNGGGGGTTGETGGHSGRARSKTAMLSNSSIAGSVSTIIASGGKNKSAGIIGGSAASFGGTAAASYRFVGNRIVGGGGTSLAIASGPSPIRTIFVNNSNASPIRCIRRQLMTRVEPTRRSAGNVLLAKHIAEVLSDNGSASKKHQQQQSTTNADSISEIVTTEQEQEQQQELSRQNRVHHFYDRRRKLLSHKLPYKRKHDSSPLRMTTLPLVMNNNKLNDKKVHMTSSVDNCRSSKKLNSG